MDWSSFISPPILCCWTGKMASKNSLWLHFFSCVYSKFRIRIIKLSRHFPRISLFLVSYIHAQEHIKLSQEFIFLDYFYLLIYPLHEFIRILNPVLYFLNVKIPDTILAAATAAAPSTTCSTTITIGGTRKPFLPPIPFPANLQRFRSSSDVFVQTLLSLGRQTNREHHFQKQPPVFKARTSRNPVVFLAFLAPPPQISIVVRSPQLWNSRFRFGILD